MANQPIEVQKVLDKNTLRDGQLFVAAYGDDPLTDPIPVLTDSTATDVSVQLQTPLTLDHNGYVLDPATGATIQTYIDVPYTIILRDRRGGIAYGPVDVPFTINSPGGLGTMAFLYSGTEDDEFRNNLENDAVYSKPDDFGTMALKDEGQLDSEFRNNGDNDDKYSVDYETLAIALIKTDSVGGYVSIEGRIAGSSYGQAKYLVKTPAQAAADGDIIDELGNHTRADSNILVLQPNGELRLSQFGAIGDIDNPTPTEDTAGRDAMYAWMSNTPSSNSDFSKNLTMVFDPDRAYSFDTTLFIDGSADNVSMITVIATGAVYYSDAALACFDIQNMNYMTWRGGQGVVRNDTSEETCMFYFKRSKYCDFSDTDIAGEGPAASVNSTGIILDWDSAVNDITGYNNFSKIRFNRINLAVMMRDTFTASNGASKLNFNVFKDIIINGCNVGARFIGASSNIFEGDFEATEKQLEFLDNANGLGSLANQILAEYSEGALSITNDPNSLLNRIVDLRTSSPTNPNLGTTSNGTFTNISNIVEMYDPAIGGMRQIAPNVDIPENHGGLTGYNRLRYGNDFSQWTATDATAVADGVLIDPDGGTGSYTLTQTLADGFIEIDGAIFDTADTLDIRSNYLSNRVWAYSATDQVASLELNVVNSVNVTRTRVIRNIPLSAGQWVPVQAATRDLGSTATTDTLRMIIRPTQITDHTPAAINIYKAGLYLGFPHGNDETDGAAEPRHIPMMSAKAETVLTQAIYLRGDDNNNISVKHTVGNIADALPTTGTHGDTIEYRDPLSGGFEGIKLCDGDLPGLGVWKTYGVITA